MQKTTKLAKVRLDLYYPTCRINKVDFRKPEQVHLLQVEGVQGVAVFEVVKVQPRVEPGERQHKVDRHLHFVDVDFGVGDDEEVHQHGQGLVVLDGRGRRGLSVALGKSQNATLDLVAGVVAVLGVVASLQKQFNFEILGLPSGQLLITRSSGMQSPLSQVNMPSSQTVKVRLTSLSSPKEQPSLKMVHSCLPIG